MQGTLYCVLFCALFVAIQGQYPVLSQNVEFVSNAPSGNMTLLGTLTLPGGVSTPVPGIVLIAGSGAGQRNESGLYGSYNFMMSPPKYPACGATTVETQVFVDIANYFTSLGFAVLRYDKRTCIAGNGVPGCSYPLCPLNETSPPSNCLNLHAFTAWDLVTDASSAVQFLASVEKVTPQNISIIAHSEGCTIAPYVANNNTENVKQVILLAGVGVPLTEVAIDQLANSVVSQTTILDSCTVMGAPATTISALKQQLSNAEQSLQITEENTLAVLNGTYPPETLIYWVDPGVPVGYLESIIEMGQWPEIYSVISKFVSNGGNICAINSPTDQQVWSQFYNPLHAALQSILDNPQDVFILEDLTHMLTPSNFSSGSVSQSVFDAILSWASQGL